MHRFLMIAALLCALAVGSVASVTAQDASPEASPEAPSAAPGGASDSVSADPAVGTPVPYIGEDGAEWAQATIEEVIDPFEDYDEGSGPDRGYRFVALRITVEATGDKAVEVSGFDFLVQDNQGFLFQDTLVFRTEEQEAADPEMEEANLAPGDSVSGLLFYPVYQDAQVVHIFWQPESGRLITLANVAQG